MEDYHINYQEYNEAIEKILADKTYNPEHHSQLPWHRLRGYIIRRIFDILKTEFSQPIHSFRIRNPFLSSSVGAINSSSSSGNGHNGDGKPQSSQSETVAQMATRLGQHLEAQFPKSPPFTIYRLAELLSAPLRYCKDTEPHKWQVALESVIWVQSAVNEFPPVVAMGDYGDDAGSDNGNEIVAKDGDNDEKNGVYNTRRHNNGINYSAAKGENNSSDGAVPQTIEMEEISWITEEHLRQIELDRRHELEEDEQEHFEDLKSENAVEHGQNTDADSLTAQTVAGADVYGSGNETVEDSAVDIEGEPPSAHAKEGSSKETSVPTSNSTNSTGKRDLGAVQGTNPDGTARSENEINEQKPAPPSSDDQTLVSQELGHSGAQHERSGAYDNANVSAYEKSETQDRKNSSYDDELQIHELQKLGQQDSNKEVDADTNGSEERQQEDDEETMANRSVEDVDMVDSTD